MTVASTFMIRLMILFNVAIDVQLMKMIPVVVKFITVMIAFTVLFSDNNYVIYDAIKEITLQVSWGLIAVRL